MLQYFVPRSMQMCHLAEGNKKGRTGNWFDLFYIWSLPLEFTVGEVGGMGSYLGRRTRPRYHGWRSVALSKTVGFTTSAGRSPRKKASSRSTAMLSIRLRPSTVTAELWGVARTMG